MIKIIGTSHLDSKEEIYRMLDKEKPQVIGVELCEIRYNLMVLPILQNTTLETKEDTSLIGKISNVIKKKAEQENVLYGSDMISACLYAVEKKIPLEFVDLDIMKTKELMEKIPPNEIEGFMKEIVEFEKINLEETIPNINVEEILLQMKLRYPIAFEFLINLRNVVIINKILKLERKYKKKRIIILLGKGHEKIVEEGLK